MMNELLQKVASAHTFYLSDDSPVQLVISVLLSIGCDDIVCNIVSILNSAWRPVRLFKGPSLPPIPSTFHTRQTTFAENILVIWRLTNASRLSYDNNGCSLSTSRSTNGKHAQHFLPGPSHQKVNVYQHCAYYIHPPPLSFDIRRYIRSVRMVYLIPS